MSVKQVILIRRDLNMRRGKEIAQGSHASQEWFIHRMRGVAGDFKTGTRPYFFSEDEIWWMENGTKKVRKMDLSSHLIEDEGLTEFNGIRTLTAVAIGPNKSELIDQITKDLKLY